MPKTIALSSAELRSIRRLIGECLDLADDPVAWRVHFASGLTGLLGEGLALFGEMENCLYGVPRDAGTVATGWEFGFHPQHLVEALASFEGDPNYSILLNDYLKLFRSDPDANAARNRTSLIADRDWYASKYYTHFHSRIGGDHSIISFQPLPGRRDRHSGLVLFRGIGRRNFEERQTRLVAQAHRMLAPFLNSPLASMEMPNPSDLTPRLKEVLQCLLEGDTDKQIAKRLRISVYTVNQYTKAIYQYFGVEGRVTLMAMWLRRSKEHWSQIAESFRK